MSDNSVDDDRRSVSADKQEEQGAGVVGRVRGAFGRMFQRAEDTEDSAQKAKGIAERRPHACKCDQDEESRQRKRGFLLAGSRHHHHKFAQPFSGRCLVEQARVEQARVEQARVEQSVYLTRG